MPKQTLDAVFENGVFRPLKAPGASIPEGQQVRLVVETAPPPKDVLALATQVYEGLSEAQIDELEQIALDRHNFFSRQVP